MAQTYAEGIIRERQHGLFGFGNNRFSEWSKPVSHMCT